MEAVQWEKVDLKRQKVKHARNCGMSLKINSTFLEVMIFMQLPIKCLRNYERLKMTIIKKIKLKKKTAMCVYV